MLLLMSTSTLVQTGKGQRERRKEDWASNLAKVPSCCAQLGHRKETKSDIQSREIAVGRGEMYSDTKKG